MSFIITTLIALLAYFITRLIFRSSKQLFAGLILTFAVISILMAASHGLTILAIHISVTSFSVAILAITFVETTLLERHITKIKKGEIGTAAKSIEREYSEIFKLVGIGLGFILLSSLSGIFIGSNISLELMLKIMFTLFSLIVYLVTFLGIKYANLKVKFAVRGIMLSFAMIILAYSVNSIFLINYLS
ncbi:hypothetical protein N9I84_05020 [Gammaproteobacteria bacterium]|nr:hypothetical protein [Gammaproteobacteria bacterium]MDA8925427.1 hypothetical protein [Gammaproteobacteria bacterium]MDC1300418.1 hypothetical protein [Gammaproteobacteria bacterium]MDC1475343.1 hypothetical protein [Gammaproteobacteria bacterium]MDC1525418.1 hypothetical protein [Gammaproteobacteria bacterium]